VRIAVDAMGGDLAPSEPVKGALLAAKEYGIEVAIVGPQARLQAELIKHPLDSRVQIVDAGDTIAMDEDDIAREVRRHPEAAINVAMALVRDGKADGVVSAGNTGAVMTSAFFVLGRIPGIERPAVGMLLPYNSADVFLIDVGANVDCRASHIVQFGEMGAAYMERVRGVKNPRVGLLNNGEEPSKGNELTLEAHEKLKESTLNFIGNIEGAHVHKGVVDVVVTDGFTGNIALKVGEGIADYVLQQVRAVIKSSVLYTGAAVLLKPALRRAFKSMRYEEYGGANLLGVNGVVVIGHGRSDGMAVKNAIRVARTAASSGLLDQMRASFQKEPKPASSGVGGGD
jgi:glycerol-3-phosphate acyltransferase PlsX